MDMLVGEVTNEHVHSSSRNYKEEFLNKINDDFNMPEALALTWELIKDHSIEAKEKIALMLDFDRVFGFSLKTVLDMKEEIPMEIIALAEMRKNMRKEKKWDEADALRKEIENRGFEVKDVENGFLIKPR